MHDAVLLSLLTTIFSHRDNQTASHDSVVRYSPESDTTTATTVPRQTTAS